MPPLIVILCLVFIVAVPLVARRQRQAHTNTTDTAADSPDKNAAISASNEPKSDATDAPSCGLSDRCTLSCDQELLVEAPEYYDDEELDAYRGIPSDKYSAAQVEEFEEVLTTMQPSEVHGWLLSLQKRGVEFPDALKDEAFLLING